MSVKSTTTELGLIKYALGHPVRDNDLATNMDILDAAYGAGTKVLKGSLTAGLVNTIAFAVQNPESVRCHILQIVLDITTAGGTATCVIDVDTATSATGTGDTIFDGIDANATAVLSSINVSDTGTNGNETIHAWDASGGTNDYITGKYLVEAASSLVGTYTIFYTKAA